MVFNPFNASIHSPIIQGSIVQGSITQFIHPFTHQSFKDHSIHLIHPFTHQLFKDQSINPSIHSSIVQGSINQLINSSIHLSIFLSCSHLISADLSCSLFHRWPIPSSFRWMSSDSSVLSASLTARVPLSSRDDRML